MKNIINFLRKIGLLHVSKGDYNSGEFDSRKDLKKEPKKKTVSKKSGLARTIVFWLSVLLTIFFLLVALSAGIGWLVLIALIWGAFLVFLKKWAFLGMYTTKLGFILFIILFIGSFVIIPANSQKASELSPSICKAGALGKKTEERVSAEIVQAGDVQKKVIKDVYELSEFSALQYGYNAQETEDGYYVTYELCKGEKSLSYMDLEAAEWNFKQDLEAVGNRSSGNYTYFENEQEDGSISRDIEKPGTYDLYVYVSYNGNKWYIGEQITFEVK